MDKFLAIMGACFGIGLSAIGLGMVFSSALSAVSRNPSVHGKIFATALVCGALIEAAVLFSFIIGVLCLFLA